MHGQKKRPKRPMEGFVVVAGNKLVWSLMSEPSGLLKTVISGSACQCKKGTPAIGNLFWNNRFPGKSPDLDYRNFRNGLSSRSKQLKLPFAKLSPLGGTQLLAENLSFPKCPSF
jgi:hypothetical protein